MPTYPLRCPCGHRSEVRQSIHKPLPRSCPDCRKRTLTQDYEVPRFNPVIDYIDPKSLGLCAERNTRRLAPEEVAARLGGTGGAGGDVSSAAPKVEVDLSKVCGRLREMNS